MAQSKVQFQVRADLSPNFYERKEFRCFPTLIEEVVCTDECSVAINSQHRAQQRLYFSSTADLA